MDLKKIVKILHIQIFSNVKFNFYFISMSN